MRYFPWHGLWMPLWGGAREQGTLMWFMRKAFKFLIIHAVSCYNIMLSNCSFPHALVVICEKVELALKISNYLFWDAWPCYVARVVERKISLRVMKQLLYEPSLQVFDFNVQRRSFSLLWVLYYDLCVILCMGYHYLYVVLIYREKNSSQELGCHTLQDFHCNISKYRMNLPFSDEFCSLDMNMFRKQPIL
jgi:hypothetical protein